MLDRNVLFSTESAADQLVFHYDLLRLPAKHNCYFPARVVCALVGAQNLDASLIRIGYRTLRFQKSMFCERRGKLTRDYMRGLCQSLRCIPSHHTSLCAEIAALMYLRCVWIHCFFNISDRIKHLVLDLHHLFCFFQYIGRLRCHQTDSVSYASGDISLRNHDIPVGLDVPYFIVGYISSCQNAKYARKGGCRLGMYFHDPGARICAAYCRGVDHFRHLCLYNGMRIAARILRMRYIHTNLQELSCRKIGILLPHCILQLCSRIAPLTHKVLRPDIVRILAVAKHLPAYIYTECPLPDAVVISALQRILNLRITTQHSCCKYDALNNLFIAGAAADIAENRFFHILFRRIRVPVNQGFSCHDHAGNTESALNRTFTSKCIDKCFLFSQAQPFHSHNFLPGCLLRGLYTGFDSLSVYQDRACTACAFTASVFAGIQPQVITQKAEQRLVFRSFILCAIYI